MKVLRYRFSRIPGRAKPQNPMPENEAEVEEQPAVVALKEIKTIKKKALLIGIQQVREDSADSPGGGLRSPEGRMKWLKKQKQTMARNALKGPHRDVNSIRELLINIYHYEPQDITVLIDDDKADHIQPTRDNILLAIGNLIHQAKENDRFFFHYSGHSDQEDTDDVEEEDRKNEFIVTSDGKRIKDDELRANLAMPLPRNSSLIAVFDSCHSGTLLDLKHFRCNRVYVPWLNKGKRRTKSLWNGNKRMQAQISDPGAPVQRAKWPIFQWAHSSIDFVMSGSGDSNTLTSLSNMINFDTGTNIDSNTDSNTSSNASTARTHHKPSLSIITDVPLMSPIPWLDTPAAPERQVMSPVAMYCTGNCRNMDLFSYDDEVKADVISISSSKDSQLTWENENGTRSMTQSLVKILSASPHPTYTELMTLVSHDIHAFYVELHSKARDYKKKVQAFNRMKKRNMKAHDVEMNNFQNPQLSSDRPLDMDRHFYP